MDEPTEVIEPEPQPLDPTPQDRELIFKEFFYEAAGEVEWINPICVGGRHVRVDI